MTSEQIRELQALAIELSIQGRHKQARKVISLYTGR